MRKTPVVIAFVLSSLLLAGCGSLAGRPGLNGVICWRG